jgi:hypothetical protein
VLVRRVDQFLVFIQLVAVGGDHWWLMIVYGPTDDHFKLDSLAEQRDLQTVFMGP